MLQCIKPLAYLGQKGRIPRLKFLVFIIINIVSALLLCVKSRRKTNAYFSGYLSAMSLGLLAITLDPNPVGHAVQEIIPHQLTARFLSAISYRFSPYFLLLAGLSISGFVPPRYRKHKLIVLAIPMMLEYVYGIIFPQESFLHVYPDYSRTFVFLAVWSSLYVLFANIIIIVSFFLETEPQIRRQKMRIAFLISPTLFVGYQVYIIPIIGSHNFTNFTALLCVFTFIGAVVFAARYGFMGIRLVIGKDFLDSSIKSVTLGTAMLNHAIKNEIQVMNACIETMQTIDLPDEARRRLVTISRATEHLTAIVSRIQHLTQENEPIKTLCDLNGILQNVLDTQSPTIRRKKITVENHTIPDATFHGDPVLIQEVLQNIIVNALEAMDSEGILTIQMTKVRRRLRLAIVDTGIGISREHLSHIFEPFFTTKRFGENYGLGLPYCYKIMQQHHGRLEIQSEEGKGTTATLTFRSDSTLHSITRIARHFRYSVSGTPKSTG